jgi:hypothetical protein
MARASTRGARPGERRGGRRRGTPNKATQARILGFERAGAPAEAAVRPAWQQPLEFLLSAMADENLPIETRLNAARWAAPYCHPHKGQIDVSDISRPLLVQVIRFGDLTSEPKPVTIEHNNS